VTPAAPTLTLTHDQAMELQRVLTRAVDHLIRGRICSQLLYDLHLNTARLELGLDQISRHHDSKETSP
jgi:hypothetical protein